MGELGGEKIGGNKSKICSIGVRSICMSSVSIVFYLCSSLLYYYYTNTELPHSIFVVYLTPGGISSGSIGHEYLNQKRERIHMNGGGESY